ncbi:protein kinase domain-containing protein [Haliangium sp.]|uniref:protein kinase domain-containing protein n=1 Tax=Haliangium sp. TaxID=2663208 RepID=UPI003D0F2E0C
MTRRCLVCGRRWLGASPSCGHPQEAEPVSGPVVRLAMVDEVPGYRLGDVLGHGGFGTVFAAVRESDRAPVAIKVFHVHTAGAQERLAIEAAALAAVGPPAVPAVYESGTLDGGVPYLVCERLRLPSLAARLAVWDGPVPGDTFLPLANAVLQAVEAIHDCGIVHRDLKPENIMVGESPPEARIIDLGSAYRPASEESRSANLTHPALALGTPDYMAPEQCEGRREDIDVRTDVYALGVLLYEMLTGRPPFFGSAAEVRDAHIARRPQAPSRVADISATFDGVVLRCLAKEPQARWDSVYALRHALRDARARGSIPRIITEPPPPANGARADAGSNPAARERVPVGLLFFEAVVDTGAVKQAVVELGGHLQRVSGAQCVAVFGLDAGDNPVRRAFDSANALIEQGITARALVAHDRVRVRTRADGSPRLFSSAASRRDYMPRADDPRGILLAGEAGESLADGLETQPVRDHIVHVRAVAAPTAAAADREGPARGAGPSHPIGREGPFADLLAGARRAFAERRPGVATVLSETGMGKSHLAQAVVTELRATVPGLMVVQIHAREPLGGSSQESLRALLRASLVGAGRVAEDAIDNAPDDHGQALLSEHLGATVGPQVWPAAALALGWISTTDAAVRRLGAAPAALRSAATRAAGESLRRLARDQPVACVIDDAHFADDATLDALEYAALSEAELPLWVCVLARPSFERARPAWGKRAADARTIRLAPLDRKNAQELCRLLLQPAENISHATLVQLVRQTQGIPLLLVELARAIRRHGLIRQHKRGDAWYLATDELDELPDMPRVEWLAERELAALPPVMAAHARLVAHLGADFTVAELDGVLRELEAAGMGDVFPLDSRASVQRLCEHGLLVAHHGGRFGFRHELIREHVVGTTPAGLGVHIHQACLRTYEHDRELPEAYRLPRLARHAAESGDTDRAAVLYLELADRAAHRHAYLEAETMYTRSLGLLPVLDRTRRMQAFSGRGAMRIRLSRYEDARDDLERARAIALELGDRVAAAELLLEIATVLDWTQDYRTSRALVERADVLAPEARPPVLAANLCMSRGRVAWRFRELDDASRLLREAVDRAEALGDTGYEILVISLLLHGCVAVAQRDLDDAQRIFDRAIYLCEERGDKLHLAGALNNRRELWLRLRDADRAATDGLRCRQIGRELGQSEIEYASSYNLAELRYFAGDLDAAWPDLRRAVEIEPSNSTKPLSLLLQARLFAYADRRAHARNTLETIRENQNQARSMGDMDALFLESEEVLFSMAELATRETVSSEWQALRNRAEAVSPTEELAEVIEMMGLVAIRRGHTIRGKRLLHEALSVCARAPHLIETRIRRRLEQQGG